jgi:hypothetical protein
MRSSPLSRGRRPRDEIGSPAHPGAECPLPVKASVHGALASDDQQAPCESVRPLSLPRRKAVEATVGRGGLRLGVARFASKKHLSLQVFSLRVLFDGNASRV